MQSPIVRFASLFAIAFTASCMTPSTVVPAFDPTVLPAALQAPADQTAFQQAQATGVQIYECTGPTGADGTYDWKFQGPEAVLMDRSGQQIGQHFGGPTWAAVDGSSVVGSVVASDPGPDRSAIPWLLLTRKAISGTGTMSQVTSVQRVQTAGGIAPGQSCTASNVKQVARVPYTATYVFYRAR